jgi:hypothetical protein
MLLNVIIKRKDRAGQISFHIHPPSSTQFKSPSFQTPSNFKMQHTFHSYNNFIATPNLVSHYPKLSEQSNFLLGMSLNHSFYYDFSDNGLHQCLKNERVTLKFYWGFNRFCNEIVKNLSGIYSLIITILGKLIKFYS